MRSRRFISLLAAVLFSAIAATLLLTVLTLIQIEEPWNIVVVSQTLALTRHTFIVVLAHAFVLGVPLFLLLRSMGYIGVVSCALGGFLVGAGPVGVLLLISMLGLNSASTGGVPTVINGVPTLAGWIEYAHAVAFAGSFGMAGGLAFWITLRLSAQAAEAPNEPAAQSRKWHARSWGISLATGLLTCTILTLPSVVRDSSCHNLFRDGRTSIGPQISADLKVSADDWPTLRQIFIDFGAAHSLSFRSDEKIRRGSVVWRDLNLCNEAGIHIDAIDQPWLAQTGSPLTDQGINFRVFELTAGSGWQPLARNLLEKIDSTWPQRTTFHGPNGKAISIEQALRGRQ